ncbi:hypothetical protein GCM10023212_29210 [Luteolibacter yonseiensis]
MDFLADEVDGLRVRRHRHAHTLRRRRFLILGWTIPAILVAATAIAALERAAFPAFARACATWSAITIITTRRPFVTAGKFLGFASLGLVVCGARPRGSEGKAGQEAAQWIGIGIAHSAESRDSFRK